MLNEAFGVLALNRIGRSMNMKINIGEKSRHIGIVVFAVITALTVCFTIVRCCRISAAQNDIGQEKDEIEVPMIMYHSILKDKSMRGDYVVTPEELEEDIIYLKNNGYTAVFVNDLINYVNNGAELPEKPVVLTFDDGFYNNYQYLMPILEKHGFKAVVSVVGSFTTEASESAQQPDPAYSYLRWTEINDMRNSGLYEFCDHTNSMHSLSPRKGVLKDNSESRDTYRRDLLDDLLGMQKLFEKNCGFKPNVFTYPYGFYDHDSMLLVRECGFKASLGAEQKINVIKRNSPECLFEMGRFNRPGGMSSEEFMKGVFKNDK